MQYYLFLSSFWMTKWIVTSTLWKYLFPHYLKPYVKNVAVQERKLPVLSTKTDWASGILYQKIGEEDKKEDKKEEKERGSTGSGSGSGSGTGGRNEEKFNSNMNPSKIIIGSRYEGELPSPSSTQLQTDEEFIKVKLMQRKLSVRTIATTDDGVIFKNRLSLPRIQDDDTDPLESVSPISQHTMNSDGGLQVPKVNGVISGSSSNSNISNAPSISEPLVKKPDLGSKIEESL